MVKISFKSNSLVIDGKLYPQIFNWQNKLFFISASGYKFDQNKYLYIYDNSNNLSKTLINTIAYLKDENIEFEFDERINALINKINADQDEFEKAKKAGNNVNKIPTIIKPQTIKRILKPYQIKGVTYLYNVINGANFSVPGSGKTSVAYTIFEILRNEKIIEKMLIIGPRSCFLPWEEEFFACFQNKPNCIRISGTKKERLKIYFQADNYDFYLCTYQTATMDQKEIIELCKKHKIFLVLDESHNIKRFEGGVWAEAILNIAPYAVRRNILTGTPIPNTLTDLWTQFTFLWPGEQLLGDKAIYKSKCENEFESNRIISSIRPFIYRTTKSELELPKPQFIKHVIDLQPYQERIYSALSAKFLQDLTNNPTERIMLREWRKARMVRLIQTATNPSLLTKYSDEFNIPPIRGETDSIIQLIEEYPKFEIPAKVRAVIKLLSDLLSNGEKVIIWTTFIHNIEMLKKMITTVNPFIVYGAVPRDEKENLEFNREQQIKKFKESKNSSVLLANPVACAESISLHKICHHAIYLDRTFNCGQYLQSLDRIHRVGLDNNEIVTYHILIAKNTIDETVDRRLIEKEGKMLKILEDEIPFGSFTIEDNQLGFDESEEAVDFAATIADLKSKITRNIQ